MRKKHDDHGSSPMPPEKKRMALMLIANTVLLVAIYYTAQGIAEELPIIGYIATFGYMACLAGFLIAYIIYNRAFTRKGLTPEMLADTMSYEEKMRIIEDANAREARSKWMLTVIIPFTFTIMIDALYLFVWTGYFEKMFT